MKFFLTMTVTVLALGTTAAMAQYKGPSADTKAAKDYVATTVSEIQAAPEDDARVMLEGQLIEKTGNETYTFRDKTGVMSVEIDDEDFPDQAVDETTTVRIHGEVDTHLTKAPDIDAERVIVIR